MAATSPEAAFRTVGNATWLAILDVLSDGPFLVTVTVGVDGDVRVLTLDESFDVVPIDDTAVVR